MDIYIEISAVRFLKKKKDHLPKRIKIEKKILQDAVIKWIIFKNTQRHREMRDAEERTFVLDQM